MRIAPLLIATLALMPPLAAQSSAPPASWASDVQLLAREMPRLHPDLFYRLPRARWDSAVAATAARIGGLTRNQATVALMELVALVRDGHTSLNPFFNPALRTRYYPIDLHRFEDGVFVRSAAPEHGALVGARVVRLGRVSIDSAIAAAARVIPHENEWWLRAWAPAWLGLVEVVDGLGLVDDAEALPLVLDQGGREVRAVIRPGGNLQVVEHAGASPIDRTGWVTMHDDTNAPLWLRNPGRPYWVEWVPDDRTLYVSYRGVVDLPEGQGNAAFWRSVFAMADSLPLARMVIDIRENIGGNSFFNRQVTRGVVARPQLDQPGKLFVITGVRTFSAAMNLARDLEQWTNATFVGEPTGQARQFFGDHVPLDLPASGLSVAVSSLRWMPYDPRDTRDFLAPALFAPLTAEAYRAGRDPAMEAIAALGTTPPLDRRVEAAVLRGDSAAAARLVEEARTDVANRFRSPEVQVNALGYRLLNARNTAAAITVFRINAAAFPQSANAWDSLGEALVTGGDREGGIAAYRRALQIDPEFPPSVQALARLGGSSKH